MQFKLNDNLGMADARKCNKELGANLSDDPTKLTKGSVIDLPRPAAEYLTKRYPALLSDASVRGTSKEAELKGVK